MRQQDAARHQVDREHTIRQVCVRWIRPKGRIRCNVY